ncbi:hypothetical protein, partial [Sphaerisporangium melleum]|uniref:hypothetical protein n=1 Tax=Sphaerisporangium melleum TaxID=321316 RepID=UPI001EF193D2
MLHPKVFQLFHPIGGVRPTPFSSACAGAAPVVTTTAAEATATTADTAGASTARTRLLVIEVLG